MLFTNISFLVVVSIRPIIIIITIKYSHVFDTGWPAIIFNTLKLLSCLYVQLPAPLRTC